MNYLKKKLHLIDINSVVIKANKNIDSVLKQRDNFPLKTICYPIFLLFIKEVSLLRDLKAALEAILKSMYHAIKLSFRRWNFIFRKFHFQLISF